jgi:repressor LexA
MKKLHPKQEQILKLLKEYIYNPVSISELCGLTGISSKGVIHHHIVQLERKGYLKRNPSNPKDYIIIDSPEKAITRINSYGMAQCGPGGNLLDESPIRNIPLPSSLLRFKASDAFIVEARGLSMQPKIFEGDIVIAKIQDSAEHGDLIVCTLNMEVLIKKLFVSKVEKYLYSLNPNQDAFPPIRIGKNDSFKVVGVVKNIFQYH